MSDIVIQAENLGKKYTIGHQAENGRYVALRDVVMQNVRGLWHKTKDLAQGKPIIQGDTLEEVWALKDVSFEIRRGEAVGIIGRNGAGKSTLLKVLSRITEPSAGRVTIKGRVASLLEVGTGFHPELTGQENIYLNGAILGMTRQEIKRKYDEIVAFAEVDKFLDTPVKRYSSGMYVRLAFAVAAHLEPEILLVDEVLAVGDVAFQQKCLGKMEEVAGVGRTVLFVSHNMGSIGRLCQTALLLEQGRVVCSGDVRQVIAKYLQDVISHEAEVFFPLDEAKTMQIRSVRILDHSGKPVSTLDRSFPFRVEIGYDVRQRVVGAYAAFDILTVDGTRICMSFDTDMATEKSTTQEPGSYISTVEFPGGILNVGSYHIAVALARQSDQTIYDTYYYISFRLEDYGTFVATRRKPVGVLAMPLKWTREAVEGGCK